jgi:putative hydrolase of the HAD superfamily
MVVFDVDDTLYLERDYVASGFRAIAAVASGTFGVAGFDTVAWSLFERGVRGDIFNRAFETLGKPCEPDHIAALVSAYRGHQPDIAMLDDARVAIAELRRLGWALGALSDGPKVSQANKVAALGIGEWARCIVLTDGYGPGYGKPHPRGFQDIAQSSGARPLVYVADNPAKDFAAPASLGWTTVRIRRSGGLHAHLPHGDDVDYEIDDLRQLPVLLHRSSPPPGFGGRLAGTQEGEMLGGTDEHRYRVG